MLCIELVFMIVCSLVKFWSFFLLVCCFCSCKPNNHVVANENDEQQSFVLRDSINTDMLRVVTLENAYSYFIDDDGNEYGFDYDMSKAFADYLNIEHSLIIAANVNELVNILETGKADIAAYRIQKSDQNRKKLLFLNNACATSMVLVQRRGPEQILSITQLIGDTIYVRKNSKYAKRLQNLNHELGGGIVVYELGDTITTDKLIHKVSQGEIDYTVADIDVVKILNSTLENINSSIVIGHNTLKAWAVPAGADSLAHIFNHWYDSVKTTRLFRLLNIKYVEKSNYFKTQSIDIPKGAVSPFDDIFKKEATVLGWDWRLLASMAWNESRFNPNAMSSQGAMGIMQLMPRTAAKYGLDADSAYNAELNIHTGVKLIQRLNVMFSKVENDEERIKFILAAYNAGAGHIFDAMKLADKYGYNQYKWDDSVENFLLKLQDKQYYNDSVCVHGFFRGKHTAKYVKQVFEQYAQYCSR